MAFGGQDSLGGGPQLLCLLLCSSPDHRPAVLRVTCQGPLQGAWLPGGLLLDAPPWVGLGLKRPSPAPRPSGGIGRRPGPLPGAWQCSCCHPGSSMAFVFLPFNFVLSGVFVVFLRRAHLSNLPARHRAACACMFSAGLPVILSWTRRASGPTLCRGAGCGRRRLGPACARPPAETASAGSPVRLS